MKGKKTYKFWLSVSLILIVISMMFSSAIASDWGKVRVTKINIAAPEGQNVNAVLYTPKDASAENKLPLILVCHGSYNSKEMQAQNYVELSRRGSVVCTIDSYCHGLSSVENGDNGTIDSTDRYTCMIHTLEYLMATLDYIDMDKIGLQGHSMGGFHCNDTVTYYLNREYMGHRLHARGVQFIQLVDIIQHPAHILLRCFPLLIGQLQLCKDAHILYCPVINKICHKFLHFFIP